MVSISIKRIHPELTLTSLDELVKDGINGLKFRTADELTEQVVVSILLKTGQ
jgi:hypothetical protein